MPSVHKPVQHHQPKFHYTASDDPLSQESKIVTTMNLDASQVTDSDLARCMITPYVSPKIVGLAMGHEVVDFGSFHPISLYKGWQRGVLGGWG